MGDRRSGARAQTRTWEQESLWTDAAVGVGGRQGTSLVRSGGGGYLDGRSPSQLRKGSPKNFAKFAKTPGGTAPATWPPADAREEALLAELDAMGLSRVMLQIARTIGFDDFMAMWRILDGAYEARADNDSGIYIRLQRLSAYKRFQRNRFIEAMAAMGMRQPEISRTVKKELGEELTDRHISRIMAGGRVKA